MTIPEFKSSQVSRLFRNYVAEALVAVWQAEKVTNKHFGCNSDFEKRFKKAFDFAVNSMRDMSYTAPRQTKRHIKELDYDYFKDAKVRTVYNKYVVPALQYAYGDDDRFEDACAMAMNRICDFEFDM